jgi:ferredoxin-NADP reductase
MHHDRNATIPKGLERGNRFDRQRDVVKAPFHTEWAIYYSAGPPAMVTGMRKMLVEAGVDEDDIRTEDFAGY